MLAKMISVYSQFRSFNIQMSHSSLIILVLLSSVIFHVEARSFGPNFPSDKQSNFQPSLAVNIGILLVMLVLTFTLILIVYAKCCHRRAAFVGTNNHQGTAAISASSRFSGIDKTVIETLPFFRFYSLEGSKEGLECVVCLSKFEDTELLRLLPKCKHAFHVSCIDNWLEKHSSCPLCRHKVSSEELSFTAHSKSMRVLWNNQSERRQDTNIELFVEREEDHRSSSRIITGSSFRIANELELLIQEQAADIEEDQNVVLKHKRRIVASDFEFNNRWSNVSSSDFMFLSSEMFNTESSNRFSSTNLENEQFSSPKVTGNGETMKVREEMEMKRQFVKKVGTENFPVFPSTSNSKATSAHASSSLNQSDKRSMSEITGFSRFGYLGFKSTINDPSLLENNEKERTRRLWLPIARRTVQWFANREKMRQQHLDV